MALRIIDGIHVAFAPLADVPDERLSRDERKLADSASGARRRLERRAGRATAREALESLLQRSTFSVVADEQGRPTVDGASARVSIAHSDSLVAAAASVDPVGIDIEPFARAERLARVVASLRARGRAKGLVKERGRASNPHQRVGTRDSVSSSVGGHESRDTGGTPWPESMLLWTAWEAMGKLDTTGVLGGSMKRPIRITSDESEEGDEAVLRGISGTIRLRWWRQDGHIFCLAW